MKVLIGAMFFCSFCLVLGGCSANKQEDKKDEGGGTSHRGALSLVTKRSQRCPSSVTHPRSLSPPNTSPVGGWRRRRDQPVWEFTDSRFVLTNRGMPAGTKVFEGGAGAIRFEGEWRLRQDGHTLHLSQVLADGQPGKVPDTAVPVQIVGLVFLNLGSFQYMSPLSYPPEFQSRDVVGKWRLVRAGGAPPAERNIKSQEIDIAADGTWTSRVEVQPPEGAADSFHGKGTWALADGMLYWTSTVKGSGPNAGESGVRLESGRLIVAPDFLIRKGAVHGEYERSAPVILKGHDIGFPIAALAFSPDDKLLASASHDKTLKLWDVATGKQRTTLKGHKELVGCVAFSPVWEEKTHITATVKDGKTIELTASFSPHVKSSYITEDNFKKLQKGMTEAELNKILRGQLWEKKMIDKGAYALTWAHVCSLEVIFRDGKAIGTLTKKYRCPVRSRHCEGRCQGGQGETPRRLGRHHEKSGR